MSLEFLFSLTSVVCAYVSVCGDHRSTDVLFKGESAITRVIESFAQVDCLAGWTDLLFAVNCCEKVRNTF